MKRTLLVFALGNIFLASIFFGAHLRQPDTTCYIDAARRIAGLAAGGDCGYRLLKPLPVLFAGAGEWLTGINSMYGLFAQNALFYILASFALFEIIRIVFKDKYQALIAAFMLGTAPPFLVFGLAYLTDMMGWFWAIFVVYLTLRFSSRALLIGAVAGIGFLYKESALGGLIFFIVYTALDHAAFIGEKFKRFSLAAAGFLIPVAFSTAAVYAFTGYTFFDWFAFAWSKPFGDEYRLFYFIKNSAATLYLYWLFFALGVYALSRMYMRGALPRDTQRFIIASGASLVLWFVWSYPAARIFYLSAPFLIGVASYGALALGRRTGLLLIALAAIGHYALVWSILNGFPSFMPLLMTGVFYGMAFLAAIFGVSRVGLLLVAVAAVLVFFEIGLRIRGFTGETIERDAQTGLMTLIPHAQFSFRKQCLENTVYVNAAGFHDFEFTKEKGDGVFRIAVLGDSYVEALHVPREAAFHNRLEKILNDVFHGTPRFEVYAFGMSGNGTFSNYLYLMKYALSYTPNLVINAFLAGNDFRNDSVALSAESGLTAPRFFPTFTAAGVLDVTAIDRLLQDKIAFIGLMNIKKIASRFAFVMWLYPRYYAAKAFIKDVPLPIMDRTAHELAVDDQVFLKKYPPVWNEAWQSEERLLAVMKQEIEKIGARFMLISLTEGFRVHPSLMRDKDFSEAQNSDLDFEKPERLLGAIAARHTISYLPLAPFFKHTADRLTVFPCDGHWNAYGHELAATALSAFVMSQPFIQTMSQTTGRGRE